MRPYQGRRQIKLTHRSVIRAPSVSDAHGAGHGFTVAAKNRFRLRRSLVNCRSGHPGKDVPPAAALPVNAGPPKWLSSVRQRSPVSTSA